MAVRGPRGDQKTVTCNNLVTCFWSHTAPSPSHVGENSNKVQLHVRTYVVIAQFRRTHDKLFFNELLKNPSRTSKGMTVKYLDKISKFRNMDWREIWGNQVAESLA